VGTHRRSSAKADSRGQPLVAVEPLHRFHGYCARFSSELAETAILQYSRLGDSVFDPFCGSGTTLVAALAHGRAAVGCDIDSLAGMLSVVKCDARPEQSYTRWRGQFLQRVTTALKEIEREWASAGAQSPKPGSVIQVGSLQLIVPVFPELNYWFPPQTVAALAAISAAGRACRDSHYEQVALVALSACILAKWPNTLSYAMDVDHTRPHRRVQRISLDRVLTTFNRRLDRTIVSLGGLYRVYADAGLGASAERPAQVIFPHDAREPLDAVPDASQALVLTSPPYFNAVDYPRSHRVSVCWMNGHAPAELVSRKEYVGLRYAGGFTADIWLNERAELRRLFPSHLPVEDPIGRRLCAFFADLERVLEQSWRVLRPGGHAVYVIANNVIRGQRVRAHAVLTELARRVGFEMIESKPRRIAAERRRFPVGPFGFNGPMTHEHRIVFRKPVWQTTSRRR
jgi:SAM-dependent methyltransferase